ncbi:hypothetical protein K458DRAFT_381957 [Lentithecium fluviatile CBS 122367]|uniref:Protein prenylyltransferase n=1 Tax=Lentithecium fluviatile CBS 122367 TaxID=1168545 RepID=A0A6G1JPG4_9PLEO|nr:hypothetical protein K458DRAFT_381957 [Lentithecium fluviatile CBS 122367]
MDQPAPAAASPGRAYKALTTFFDEHENEVLNIEILPPAFPPPDGICMQEGLNLGVPKETLVAAFIEARQIFSENIKQGPHSIEAYKATRPILLLDPEHLTAANFLKRRLEHLQSRSQSQPQTIYHHTLHTHLTFQTTILTSPLHRQTKSPTLWHHRFWLVKHHILPNILLPNHLPPNRLPPNPSSPGLDVQEFLQSELNVICKSGERHPKNYYAFQYARRLFNLVLAQRSVDEVEVVHMKEVLQMMRSWCSRHPSDISGFSFLAWLLHHTKNVEDRRRVVDRVVGYALSVGLANESVWWFVRTVLADGTVGEGEGGKEILGVLVGWLRERGGKSHGGGEERGEIGVEERVRQTVEWVGRYGILQPSSTADS